MSGCRRWGDEIGAVLDGELPAEALALFEGHLPECDACSRALELQRGADLQLAGLGRVEPSPQFEARFWARLARDGASQPTGRARRFGLRFPGFALAGAGLVALLWVLTPGDAALPERDWQIVAETDFELLLDADHEILLELEELEAWDGSEEI